MGLFMEDYFGIDTEAVWDTVRNNIPPFKKQIHTYIHTKSFRIRKSIKKRSKEKSE
jgi:uncharacterized protein with HEPN domain